MSILIGIIIGLVMGLTGAGGALVAIPLFIGLLGMGLKEASVYSLLAVVVASLSNFYHQRKLAELKLSITFILSSSLGSFLSSPYKTFLPDIGVALILTSVALYSLYSVWSPLKISNGGEELQKFPLLKTIFIGLLLGVLTTFTGLGGGVLMLPVLLKIYHMPQKNAVATSLVVVGLSSLSSFVIQFAQGSSIVLDEKIGLMVIGILFTSFLVKMMIAKLPPRSLELIRQIVFSIVVVLAIVKIF